MTTGAAAVTAERNWTVWPVALLVLAGAAQVEVQRRLDAHAVAQPPTHPAVPSFPVALAQGGLRRRAAADIQWIRAMSYAGDARFPEGHRNLPEFIRLTLELDPTWEDVYLFGSLLMSSERENVEAAVEVLDQAEQHFPSRWVYPFMAGANQLFELGNASAAAAAWTRASKIPGAPAFLGQMAARVLASHGDCQAALETLHTLLGSLRGESQRLLAAKERSLRWECSMQQLEGAVRVYRSREGHPPAALEELVRAGDLPGVPADPFGGRYFLDAQGRVQSTTPQPRLKRPVPPPTQ